MEEAKPAGVFVAPDKRVYITDLAGNQVIVFSEDGKILRQITSKRVALRSPQGLAVNDDGTIWVADTLSNVVRVFDQNKQKDLKLLFKELII